mmetsp:Transcript_29796/g.69923  ORF Transcript_29796/g.69923 Transcript_29796/m.69923 type:complete len:124 (-) Transcript_29796:16-387(-)
MATPIRAHHHPPTAILASSSLRLHTEDIGSNHLRPPLVILNTSSTNNRNTSSTNNRTAEPALVHNREDMVTILLRKGNRAGAGTLGPIMGTPRPEVMRRVPGASIGGRTMKSRRCLPWQNSIN